MRNTKYIYVALWTLVFLSCKKNETSPDNPPPDNNNYVISVDSLTHEQDSVLMANSIPNPLFESLIGADGGLLKHWIDSVMPYWNDTLSHLRTELIQNLTPYQQRVFLLNKTLSVAWTLAQKKSEYDTGQYSAQAPFSPPQWGIAYSWGSRNYRTRKIPPGSGANALHYQDKVKGLDCSGFIWTIFTEGGLTQLHDFSAVGFPSAMNAALPSSIYNKVQLVNKGHNLSPSQMEPGDVIVWPGHIGMIAVTQSPQVFMYNSHGTEKPFNLQDQRNNQGQNRGVHSINWFGQANTWFPGGYDVWRFQVI